MRDRWLALVGLIVAASLAGAQQGTAPPAPAGTPGGKRLDVILLRWEQEMQKAQTLAVQCTRTTVDKAFGDTSVFEGTAKYMRPNLAMLEMKKKTNPQMWEKYIYSGTFLWEFAPLSKEIRIHELPPGQPDNLLSFLIGMKGEEIKRRYDLNLIKEDKWYVYIEILPRHAADKAEFQKARLVLHSQTLLPRELWFEQPNGNEVMWDMPKVETGVRLMREEFTSPKTPPGWTLKKMPRAELSPPPQNIPPRIARPNKER